MRSSVSKGNPLNPPIWWVDPTDPVAQKINDGIKINSNFQKLYLVLNNIKNLIFYVHFVEYLLGEKILVAPVIVEGATSRDIYLPSGIWRDENHPNSQLIKGRKWLRKYPAKLDVLPWFTKVKIYHVFQ